MMRANKNKPMTVNNSMTDELTRIVSSILVLRTDSYYTAINDYIEQNSFTTVVKRAGLYTTQRGFKSNQDSRSKSF